MAPKELFLKYHHAFNPRYSHTTPTPALRAYTTPSLPDWHPREWGRRYPNSKGIERNTNELPGYYLSWPAECLLDLRPSRRSAGPSVLNLWSESSLMAERLKLPVLPLRETVVFPGV